MDILHSACGENVKRYVGIHRNLFSEEPISEESIEYLRKMPHACYVVLWSGELESDTDLRGRFAALPERFSVRHENAAGIVIEIVK